MNRFAVGAVLLLLAACVTTHSNRRPRDVYQGQTMDSLQKLWGKPDNVQQDGDVKLVVYKNIISEANPEFDPAEGNSPYIYCDANLKVDAKGTITEWSLDKEGCSSREHWWD